jgi:hypothetical protein
MRLMNRPAKCAVVVGSSLVTGVALFVGGFVAMDFVWTHFVVTNPKELSIGDGVVVIGGGLVAGTTLGLLGIAVVFYRFWPRRIAK